MDKSLLVSLFGFRATLVHGDTLVLDRWRWLKARLPPARNGERLLDVGCGTGAFTIGAARLGYQALGLSWDERNQAVAAERARLANAPTARFEAQDIRQLDRRHDLEHQFDVVLCCETIEHILDDRKLMRDSAACLKPGGRLLLTTPFLQYRAITESDNGPFSTHEDGGHVRRGYSKAMLQELCASAGLVADEVSFCSGVLSQKITWILRRLSAIHPMMAWTLVLPLRVAPPLLDSLVTPLLRWPAFSICVEATAPAHSESGDLPGLR